MISGESQGYIQERLLRFTTKPRRLARSGSPLGRYDWNSAKPRRIVRRVILAFGEYHATPQCAHPIQDHSDPDTRSTSSMLVNPWATNWKPYCCSVVNRPWLAMSR